MMLRMFGVANLLRKMRKWQKSADFGEAWVGSMADYGPYQEFGTRSITPRPHWRVVLQQTANRIGSDKDVQSSLLDFVVDPAEARSQGMDSALAVALMIERRVKEVITEKHIIDTGNYRASVAAANEEADAAIKSERSLTRSSRRRSR